MADRKALWDKVRGWYHFPALKEPQYVHGMEGGACYDFKKRETLVDESFIEELKEKSGLSEDRCLEGTLAHEIGHYMVFPRDLGTLILAAKMIDDFFGNDDREVKEFIFQAYADMANDTASVLQEQRTSAILDLRNSIQAILDDPVNNNIRAVMLGYLHHQAQRGYALPEELEPYLERMLEVDFLNDNQEKMRLGLFTFGNIITDMIKRYDKGGKGDGKTSFRLGSGLPGEGEMDGILKDMTPGQLKEALRDISGKITKREFERVRKWLESRGVKLPKPSSGMNSIGTSEGDLPIDQEVIEYYEQLSLKYPIVTTKKLLPTEATARAWSETEKWRPGTDATLALPGSSGGLFLPGITRKVLITERPIQTTDYKVPHLLVIIDSSGSMPEPKTLKSHAVLGGYCASRSYFLHGSSIGVINFSGSSFYLPYTRELNEALGAISAYQGGGTTIDVEMVRKMLGPEMAELYSKNPDRNMGHLPQGALKKELSINMPHLQSAFEAESIDVVLFTDGGISNLEEVLKLFEERAELNRATIVLTHGFAQALDDRKGGKIDIHKVEDEKDIPGIIIRETQKSFNLLDKINKGGKK